jgi:anaerobic glycerol-3-phosphate dehydrogenase
MTAGVHVNRRMQPQREGATAWRNLFAAGMVIGGFASRYALCADGVALATGWWAGREAAKEGTRA